MWKMARIGLLALFALLGIVLFAQAAPAAAQCQVRTDWPLITVQRGESLTGLARRYNTTVNALVTGNCLTSTRLRTGQRLHVPLTQHTGGAPPAIAPATISIGVSLQQFEGGFMVWRSDTGAIWAFDISGRALAYTASEYGSLPLPRQAGQLRTPTTWYPNNGFGRLWFNFPAVQNTLGGAISGEMADTMTLYPFAPGREMTVNLTRQPLIRLDSQGAWRTTTGPELTALPTLTPLPPSPTPRPSPTFGPGDISVGSTFQAFERGFMVWMVNTGIIRVYSGDLEGVIQEYPPSAYGGLRIVRDTATPPGFVRPENGFGRVWHNFPSVRNALGWATGAEVGYLSDVPAGFPSFTLPGGQVVSRVQGQVWRVDRPWSTQGGPPVTPSPTSYRTGVSYQPFERGFMLWNGSNGDILVWSLAEGLLAVPVESYSWMSDLSNIDLPPAPPGRNFPAIRPVQGFGKLWSNASSIRRALGWAVGSEVGFQSTFTLQGAAYTAFDFPGGSAVRRAGAPPEWLVTGFTPAPYTSNLLVDLVPALGTTATAPPPPLPTSTLTPVRMAYQPFETGFMVWRSDSGQVYAFIGAGGSGTLISTAQPVYEGLPDAAGTPPSIDRLLPINAFGKVWANVPGVREGLGWATGPERCFISEVFGSGEQTNLKIPMRGIVSFTGNAWGQPSMGETQFPLDC